MKKLIPGIIVFIFLFACSSKLSNQLSDARQPIHNDISFQQDFSIKYNLENDSTKLYKVFSDRNGVVKIYSSAGILATYAGAFLYPGTLVPDVSYRPIRSKKIAAVGVYDNQFIYLDDKAVLSNAWAGKLYSKHSLPNASLFAGGEDFAFLVSDGQFLQYVKDSEVLWQGRREEKILDIRFDSNRNSFWLLGSSTISFFSAKDNKLSEVYKGENFTSFVLTNNNQDIVVGTHDGYVRIDTDTKKQKGDIQKKIPWTEITSVQEVDGKLWFGSAKGAFMLRDDGKYNYYASKRWLPSDKVIHISKGKNNAVLILTDKGLGEICFKEMTLHDKAIVYEKQVRQRHIRNGFNATITGMKEGDISTGHLKILTMMACGHPCTWVHRYSGMPLPNLKRLCKTAVNLWMRWSGYIPSIRFGVFLPGLSKEEAMPCTTNLNGFRQPIRNGTGNLPPAAMKPLDIFSFLVLWLNSSMMQISKKGLL
jgi:hypothetical protein